MRSHFGSARNLRGNILKKSFVLIAAMFSVVAAQGPAFAQKGTGSATAIKKVAATEQGKDSPGKSSVAKPSPTKTRAGAAINRTAEVEAERQGSQPSTSASSSASRSGGSTGWTPQKTISPPWNAGYQPHRMISRKVDKENVEITDSSPDNWKSMRSYEEAMEKKGERTMVIINGRRF